MSSFLFVVAAASTFNLVCTGVETVAQRTSSSFASKPLSEQPFRTVLRVDLQSKKWCAGECATTRDIHSVDERQIIFDFEEDKKFETSQLDLMSYVQRESGDYFWRRRTWLGTDMIVTIRQGSCEPAPFGGLPQRKF